MSSLEAKFINVQFRWGFCASSCKLSGLRFLYGFLKPWRRGYGFLESFLLSPLNVQLRLHEFEEIRKRLCEFEEIVAKLSRWMWIARRKTHKTFVWILSKNSVSAGVICTVTDCPNRHPRWTKRPFFLGQGYTAARFWQFRILLLVYYCTYVYLGRVKCRRSVVFSVKLRQCRWRSRGICT